MLQFILKEFFSNRRQLNSINSHVQSWIEIIIHLVKRVLPFIGRTDAETEAPILWLPDVKNWFIGKDPDAGKVWIQEEKRTTGMRCLDGITNSMECVWAISGSWWWTGKPGVLQSTGSQRARHDWATELNWTDERRKFYIYIYVVKF